MSIFIGLILFCISFIIQCKNKSFSIEYSITNESLHRRLKKRKKKIILIIK